MPIAEVNAVVKGAAYLYALGSAGWVSEQKLVDANAVSNAGFGSVLELVGDTASLSSPFGPPNAEGRVLVFEHNGVEFALTQTLMNSASSVFDLFGISLASDGQSMLSGALGESLVYVFEDSAAGWVETQILAPFGAAGAHTNFGGVVDVQGNRALVATNSMISNHPGAAFSFARVGGVWVPDEQLTPSDGLPGDGFGSAAVYVYQAGAAGWVESAKLSAPDGQSGDFFGSSLALRGERLAVGAPMASGGTGAVYLFEHRGSGWESIARLPGSGAGPPAFGKSLALGPDQLFSAANQERQGAQAVGAVHVISAPAAASSYAFCDALAPCGNSAGGSGKLRDN